MAQGVATLGDAFQVMAVATLTYALTHSGLQIGFQTVFSLVPYLVVAPLVGRLQRHGNPWLLMLAADLWRGGIVLLYPWCTHSWQIFALNALWAAGGAVWEPARNSVLRLSVDRSDLLVANSLGRTVGAVANLLGPLAAGVVVAQRGTVAAFYINAASFLVSAVLLGCSWRHVQRGVSGRARGLGLQGRFNGYPEITGLLRHNRRVREVIVSTAVFTCAQAAVNIAFYPFMYRVLEAGPEGLGLVLSSYLGAHLLGAAVAARFGQSGQGQAMFRLSLAASAAIWGAYGLAGNLPVVIALCVPDGVLAASVAIIAATVLQGEPKASQVGGLAGLAAGVNAVAQIAGTLLGGYLSDVLEGGLVFFVVAFGYAVLSLGSYYALGRS